MAKPIKFHTRSTSLLEPGCTFIVGQNPGNIQVNNGENVVWRGNRSGNFIDYATSDIKNLYFTNICNYQEVNKERVEEGLKDLEEAIRAHKPRKIVCLGLYAAEHIRRLHHSGIELVIFHHPSFVLRFNRGVEQYRDKLRKELMR